MATTAAFVMLGLLSIAQAPAHTRPATSGDFAALAAKADAARDAGRLDEAASLYQQALALRPRWTDGWWSLGTVLYDQDTYAPAARAFRRVIAHDPNNGTAHLMLALCEYQLGEHDKSLQHIRTAKQLGVQKDEQLVRVLHYHEALLLLRKGRYEDGLETLRLLVKAGVESDELETALGLGVLLIRPQDAPAVGTPPHQVVLRAGRAERFSLAMQGDAARQAYGELVQEFPTFPNVHYAYGRFLLTGQGSDGAIAQFKEEIANQPAHVRARMQIAAAYHRVDSSAGIPFAQEVVRLEPAYPFGHYLLGLLYLDTRDIDRSIEQLETAARMVPREAQFQFALGNAYARAGRKADAARARAAFRRLGGASQSPSATPAGEPRLDLDRADPR